MAKLRQETNSKKEGLCNGCFGIPGFNLDEMVAEEIAEAKEKKKGTSENRSRTSETAKTSEIQKLKTKDYSQPLIQILKIILLVATISICCQLYIDYQKAGYFSMPEWTKEIINTFKSIFSFFTRK
ncbi:hypothetical protein [Bacillus velezensis]|uniref:hypothetical protein n=1 Tax=Bacillus velezensis TaxID=492670 RepID=UPI0018E872DC|nr:hypothetical protein [Bacillus velezensis]